MKLNRVVLASGFLAMACGALAQQAPGKTYIVQLSDAPAATYDGSIGVLGATRPAPGGKLDASSPGVRAYVNYLDIRRSRELASIGNVPVLHQYNLAFNGFSAVLTEAQVKALKSSNGVASVVESELVRADTSRTPGFLGLSAPGGIWSLRDGTSRNVKGEDIIIGVIDTGIWPENTSFSDKVDATGKPVPMGQSGTQVYGAPPAKWRGSCISGEGFTAAMCNNKLIGARFYPDSFLAAAAASAGVYSLNSLEFKSPRDGEGHGSHTAGTAGGNSGVEASIGAVSAGVLSGIAPRARIASYKALWTANDTALGPPLSHDGGQTADILRAIDDAVADGVDVINYSVSGTQTSFTDPVEIAFFNATAAGIFVAASAGNSGPANQVAHISPWLATVAASTHDRFTAADVTLGATSGAVFNGPSYQTTGIGPLPIVLAQNSGTTPFASLADADKTALMRCLPAADRGLVPGSTAAASLDPAKVTGKMVICLRGSNVLINKAAFVKAAGGAAMLLLNHPALANPVLPASSNTTVLQPYVIPAVHLTAASYPAVAAYAATPGATASFGPGLQVAGTVAPVMAGFSSRGPNKANGNILKPDISGPGVDVVAAFTPVLSQVERDAVVAGTFTPPANATSLQGTSMSSPHVAGAAALFKQLYPSWSSAAIKSALMTTTTPIKLASGAVDPDRWGYGAGHMNPNGATNPGLVYDAGASDYGRFLCGLNLTPPLGIGTCAVLGTTAPWNLNLASLTASDVPGSVTFLRTVKNVTGAAANFVSSASLPGWTVVVNPPTLALAADASASFSVTATRTSAVVGAWTFGTMAWNDGVRTVTSPLSAKAVGFVAPVQISDTRVAGSGSKVFGVVSAYTGSLALQPTGLVTATLNAGSVVSGVTQCFNFAIGAGEDVVRFQLFNGDTLGGSATDLDLDVFRGLNGTGTLVGSSGGGTSDEVVTLKAPAAGNYSACVIGYNTPAAGATFSLSSWVVGPASGPQTLRAAGPSAVYVGGAASIGLGWSVPAGKRYLGNVKFIDNTAAVIGSTIVFVDNH